MIIGNEYDLIIRCKNYNFEIPEEMNNEIICL